MLHEKTMDSNESRNGNKKNKSVSFSTLVEESPREAQEALEINIPTLRSPLWPSPIHYLLLIHALYSQGLTKTPYRLMMVGVPILAFAQIFYGLLLKNSSTHANQIRNVKDNGLLIVITATVASALLANVIFVVLILMGAPLAMFLPETYVLAFHISLLAIQPLLVFFRLEVGDLIELFRSDRLYSTVLSNEVLCSAFCSIIGAWVGVIPIPLDWDRPWQQWPLTILTGAYVGGFVGHSIAAVNKLAR